MNRASLEGLSCNASTISAGAERTEASIKLVVGSCPEVIELPVADGGDGTVDAAIASGFEPVAVTVSGPTGDRCPPSMRGRVPRP